MPEESRFLSFHGVRVHFRLLTPGGVPRARLMLLCSPLLCAFHWRKLLPELQEQGCLAVACELPGFGHGDCGAQVPQDVRNVAYMLWGILDEVDRQTAAPGSLWQLVSHGSACATALEMAMLYPDSVKALVELTPLLRCRLPGQPERWYREHILSAEGFRRLAERLAGYPLDDYVLDRMRGPLLREGAAETLFRMLRARTRLPQRRGIFCPTMVLLGGRDPLLTEEVRGDVGRCFPDAELHVLQSAGHFPMETHSKALRDYLRGWIRYTE